eukprot:6302266-Amphidinium_carterae.1
MRHWDEELLSVEGTLPQKSCWHGPKRQLVRKSNDSARPPQLKRWRLSVPYVKASWMAVASA